MVNDYWSFQKDFRLCKNMFNENCRNTFLVPKFENFEKKHLINIASPIDRSKEIKSEIRHLLIGQEKIHSDWIPACLNGVFLLNNRKLNVHKFDHVRFFGENEKKVKNVAKRSCRTRMWGPQCPNESWKSDDEGCFISGWRIYEKTIFGQWSGFGKWGQYQ